MTALSGQPWPLCTERLELRPLIVLDAARVQSLAGNWTVSQTLDVVPYPYPDGLAEVWIQETRDKIKADEDYALAIVKAGEGLIGVISVNYRQNRNEGILGYWLGEPYWGQGYTTEAAAAMIEFAAEKMVLDRILARVFLGNQASENVLRKIGFVKTGEEDRTYPHRGGVRRVSLWDYTVDPA